MKLIVLAHYGEAQFIIEEYSLSKKSEELYQNEEFTLLLTGEGPFEACARVSRALASGAYSEVINLGIAGSLDDSLSLNGIHEVRSIYLAIDGKLQYKSFELGSTGVDLVTSFERILHPEKARPLTGMGKLVDREGWGVAFACKEHGISLRSFKLVSDQAGTLGACEVIRDLAQSFSLKLLEKLKEIVQLPLDEEESQLPLDLNNDFYFTFSLKHKFQNLLKQISVRDQLSVEEVLKKLPIHELTEAKLAPKLRAKALLAELEILLDPFKGKLQEALNDWKKVYRGIDLVTDPQWENDEIRFSFVASTELELSEKIQTLQKVDFKPFHNILAGKIHVE